MSYGVELKYDYIQKEYFILKIYDVYLVKQWEEKFIDERGVGFYFVVKRPFKNYILKYELMLAHRINKQFDNIFNALNTGEV